jgi:shikimate kinase
MKIVLIGFMGAGKTTVAKLLAEKLKLEFIDTDALVIKKSGRSTGKEIFEKDGELSFRELEIAVAKELKNKKNAILATGGGVVMNKIILDYLGQDGLIIFLKTSFDESKNRVLESLRPLFQDAVKAKELYNFRLPLYEHYANIILETDNKTAEEVATIILGDL